MNNRELEMITFRKEYLSWFVLMGLLILNLIPACSQKVNSNIDESINTSRFALSTSGITVRLFDAKGDLILEPSQQYLLDVSHKNNYREAVVTLKSPTELSCSYIELRFNGKKEHPSEIQCGSALLKYNPITYLGSPENGLVVSAQVLLNQQSKNCSGDLLVVKLVPGSQTNRDLSKMNQDPVNDPIIFNAYADSTNSNTIYWTYKLRGEANLNQLYDFADFGVVGSKYGKEVATTPSCEPADADGKGKVDFADFGVIGADYNKGIGGLNIYRDDNASPSTKLGLLSTNTKLSGDFSLDTAANSVRSNGFKEYWHTFSGTGRYIKLELLDLKGKAITGHSVVIDTSTVVNPQWAMFGKDKTGSRRTTAIGPAYPKIKWEFNASSEFTIDGAAAIDASGTIYFGSQTKKFYSYKSDGTEKWTFSDSAGEITTAPMIDSIGNIYFGSVDKNLYALKPDKSLLWKFETGDEIISSPILGDNGVVYLSSGDAKLYAVGADGKAKWSYEFTDGKDKFVGTTPAIGPNGTIYSAAEDQKLYAFKPEDGSVKWKSEADLNIMATSSPAVATDGTIYVGGIDGVLTAINPDTGKTKWTFQEVPDLSIFTAAPGIDAKGNILIGSINKKLYCIGSDGKKLWEFSANEGISCAPLIDGKGAIYFATGDKLLYKINSDGTEDWHIELGAGCSASPVMANNGTIYIGCQNGSMYAIGNDSNPPQVYPPENVVASNGADETKVTVTWTAPVKGLVPDGYKIFRSDSETGTYSNLASVGAVLTYDDTKVPDEKTYWYYVIALNGSKESIPSASESGYLKPAKPPTRSNWWMFGGEPTHQHRSLYSGPATKDNIKWTKDLGEKIGASAAIGSDGTIFIGSNKFWALNPSDGSEKWSFDPGPGDWFFDVSPAIAEDGTIYFGGANDDLNLIIALDSNGKELWRQDVGSAYSSPAIAKDGTVYVGGDIFYAFTPSAGPKPTIKWTIDKGIRFRSSPAIGSDGTIYVGCNDKNLWAFNPDGTDKWKYTTSNEVYSSPAIASDGTIYIPNLDSILYAINPDGSKKWSVDISTWQMYSSPAIGSDGTVFIGTSDCYLFALNPADGSTKWKCMVGTDNGASKKGIQWARPVIDKDGVIFVGASDCYLYSVSADGKQLWKLATYGDQPGAESIVSSPAIASDGTLYIGSDGKKLYALSK